MKDAQQQKMSVFPSKSFPSKNTCDYGQKNAISPLNHTFDCFSEAAPLEHLLASDSLSHFPKSMQTDETVFVQNKTIQNSVFHTLNVQNTSTVFPSKNKQSHFLSDPHLPTSKNTTLQLGYNNEKHIHTNTAIPNSLQTQKRYSKDNICHSDIYDTDHPTSCHLSDEQDLPFNIIPVLEPVIPNTLSESSSFFKDDNIQYLLYELLKESQESQTVPTSSSSSSSSSSPVLSTCLNNSDITSNFLPSLTNLLLKNYPFHLYDNIITNNPTQLDATDTTSVAFDFLISGCKDLLTQETIATSFNKDAQTSSIICDANVLTDTHTISFNDHVPSDSIDKDIIQENELFNWFDRSGLLQLCGTLNDITRDPMTPKIDECDKSEQERDNVIHCEEDASDKIISQQQTHSDFQTKKRYIDSNRRLTDRTDKKKKRFLYTDITTLSSNLSLLDDHHHRALNHFEKKKKDHINRYQTRLNNKHAVAQQPLRRVRLPRPIGYVGMALYSPATLAYLASSDSQSICDTDDYLSTKNKIKESIYHDIPVPHYTLKNNQWNHLNDSSINTDLHTYSTTNGVINDALLLKHKYPNGLSEGSLSLLSSSSSNSCEHSPDESVDLYKNYLGSQKNLPSGLDDEQLNLSSTHTDRCHHTENYFEDYRMSSSQSQFKTRQETTTNSYIHLKLNHLPPAPKRSDMIQTTTHRPIIETPALPTITCPTCKFDKIKRELHVLWSENNELRVQKYSCKKLGKETVFRRAQELMLHLAYLSISWPPPYPCYTSLSQPENHDSMKRSTITKPPDEIIYDYDGPYCPTLTYRKLSREWIVHWTVQDIKRTARWSCKKLGKFEAVTRAERFVNLLSEGVADPQVRRSSKKTSSRLQSQTLVLNEDMTPNSCNLVIANTDNLQDSNHTDKEKHHVVDLHHPASINKCIQEYETGHQPLSLETTLFYDKGQDIYHVRNEYTMSHQLDNSIHKRQHNTYNQDHLFISTEQHIGTVSNDNSYITSMLFKIKHNTTDRIDTTLSDINRYVESDHSKSSNNVQHINQLTTTDLTLKLDEQTRHYHVFNVKNPTVEVKQCDDSLYPPLTHRYITTESTLHEKLHTPPVIQQITLDQHKKRQRVLCWSDMHHLQSKKYKLYFPNKNQSSRQANNPFAYNVIHDHIYHDDKTSLWETIHTSSESTQLESMDCITDCVNVKNDQCKQSLNCTYLKDVNRHQSTHTKSCLIPLVNTLDTIADYDVTLSFISLSDKSKLSLSESNETQWFNKQHNHLLSFYPSIDTHTTNPIEHLHTIHKSMISLMTVSSCHTAVQCPKNNHFNHVRKAVDTDPTMIHHNIETLYKPQTQVSIEDIEPLDSVSGMMCVPYHLDDYHDSRHSESRLAVERQCSNHLPAYIYPCHELDSNDMSSENHVSDTTTAGSYNEEEDEEGTHHFYTNDFLSRDNEYEHT